MRVKLKDVMFSYLYALTPKVQTNEKGEEQEVYSVSLVMPKGSQNAKAVEEAILAEAVKRFGQDAEKVVAGLKATGKCVFRDGDADFTKDGELRKDSIGNMILRARCYSGPIRVLNKESVEITPETVSAFTSTKNRPPRSGDFGDALVDLYIAKDSAKGGRRISAAVTAIAFKRDGKALGREEMSAEELREFFDYESVALEDMAS